MKICFIKSSPCISHVRVSKFIDFFKNKKIPVSFFCWKRIKSEFNTDETYILCGGGYGSKLLYFFYPVWVLLVFLRVLLKNNKDKDLIYFVVDFESSLPVYLASFFRNDVVYVYDIHDDFSLRYKFPNFFNKFIEWLDVRIKAFAKVVIHVDENRVRDNDKNYIIIYNTPKDFFDPNANKSPNTFAVTGLLSKERGLDSIKKFAIDNAHYNFVVAGLINDECASDFILLPNVHYLGVLKQEVLFSKINHCSFIFSLYNPDSKINQLAASNKLYDAMMLGIPVITNKKILASDFVTANDIGVVVNFSFDDSWDVFSSISNERMRVMSKNGRQKYLECYSFESNVVKKIEKLFGI